MLGVDAASADEVLAVLAGHGLGELASVVGATSTDRRVRVAVGDEVVLDEPVRDLAQTWDEVSFRIAALRDNPACAEEEHDAVGSDEDPGLVVEATFDPLDDVAAPYLSLGVRPKVAILREQGVNSHVETAFAFDRAGFDTYDVHMTDLQAGRFDLADVVGLVACGGFSYGDTLGAGEGWARSVLFNERLTESLPRLLPPRRHLRPRHLQRVPDVRRPGRPHPGCRGVAAVHPQPVGAVRGAAHPRRGARVVRRSSRRGWPAAGSRSPSRTARASPTSRARGDSGTVARVARFVDHHGAPATAYPFNPNGSPGGLTAVTTPDGRFTAMMPHPERVARNAQMSWTSGSVEDESPWLRMFRNARVWVD